MALLTFELDADYKITIDDLSDDNVGSLLVVINDKFAEKGGVWLRAREKDGPASVRWVPRSSVVTATFDGDYPETMDGLGFGD